MGGRREWKTHIDTITVKASRTVGFLRHNLYNCTKEVYEATYCTLVRPTLEYASAVSDPFRTTDINRFEQVQRRAARFVHRNYWDRTTGCVSENLVGLLWWVHDVPTYSPCCTKSKEDWWILIRGPYCEPTTNAPEMDTAYINQQHQYSFYPRTVQEWNRLPATITCTDSPTRVEFTDYEVIFPVLTVCRGLLLFFTDFTGRGRLSHPPIRSTIQSDS